MSLEQTTFRRRVAFLRRPSVGFFEAFWFAAIALVTAGPLLGSGYLLLLDFPSGPEFPRLSRGPADLYNTVPLLAAHDLLGAIHDYLPDKLFLLAPVLVGGTGMARLSRRRLGTGPLPALFAGTLYVLNPFVLDRYLAGHLYFLVGYALLPSALGAAWALAARPSTRAAVVVGVWLAVLAAVSVHVAGAYAVIVVVGTLAIRGDTRARAAAAAIALSLAALLCAYWVVPAILDPPQAVLPADLETFGSRPAGLAVFPALLALEGFWRDEFPRATAGTPALYLVVVPIVGLAVLGAVALARQRRAVAAALGLAALLGLGLAASTAVAPSASVARWAVDRIPALGAYREPQKLLLLTIVAYALLGAAGLEALARRAPQWLAATLAAAALACVVVYGHAQLWGLDGRVELAHYPASWSRAERAMAARGDGPLLVLPWRLYAVWSFSGGRIVANPARSFFPRRVLVPEGEGSARDDTSRALERVLARRSRVRSLGRLLAPLDVHFVAWTREADWWRYDSLMRQRDLVPIFRDSRLVVFENAAWRPRVD